MDIWGWVALGVIALFSFGAYKVFWLFSRNKELTDEQQEALERQIEIESGVIKSNAKADRMLDDPEYKRRMFDEDNKDNS